MPNFAYNCNDKITVPAIFTPKSRITPGNPRIVLVKTVPGFTPMEREIPNNCIN